MGEGKGGVEEQNSAWETARSAKLSRAKELESLLPGYGYASKSDASLSDEKLKASLVKDIRRSKSAIMNLLGFLYQIQQESVGSDFKLVYDELSIFCDEIKVSPFKWKEGLSESFFERLLDRDYFLLRGASRLNHFLDKLTEYVLAYKEKNGKEFDLESIRETVAAVRKQLRELVILFKERESIFEIESRDLDEAFREVQEEIRKRI